MAAMSPEELQSWVDVLDDPDFDIQLQHIGYAIEKEGPLCDSENW